MKLLKLFFQALYDNRNLNYPGPKGHYALPNILAGARQQEALK